jgi:hypothetical protein
MKIPLDECLPLDLRHSFPSHAAHTAQWAGLEGKKNGEHTSSTALRQPQALYYSGSLPHKSD